eukprot:gene5072-5313_t
MLGHTRCRLAHGAAGKLCNVRANLQRLSLCHLNIALGRLNALPQLRESDHLKGACTHVFWDLDNIRPPELARDLIAAVEELKALLEDGLGASVQQVALYANGETSRQLGAGLRARLAAAGVTIHEVATRNQAADMQLTSDAFTFVQQQRRSHQQQQEQQGEAVCSAGSLVCVSNDMGFATLLQYASGAGLAAIAVMSVPSPKYLPGLLPDLRRHSSAQHCRVVLSWRPQPAAVRAAAAATAALTAAVPVDKPGRSPLASPISGPSTVGTAVGSADVMDSIQTSTSNSSSARTALAGSHVWYALPAAQASTVFIEAVWFNPSTCHSVSASSV